MLRKGALKGKKKRAIEVIALLLAWLLILPMDLAYALPRGEKVVSGEASFTKPNAKTLKIKTSDKVIINYESFDIGRDETVRFIQPSSRSIALNRVVGEDPSEILGRLLANGRIFLINPNGILFGKKARIDTGSFLASTLDISNEDFLRGHYVFEQKEGYAPGYIINRGVIKAAPGGFVVLASPFVANDGKIKVKAGKVVLAGVKGYTLDLEGDGLINFFIPSDEPLEGDIELKVKKLPKIIKKLINTEGIQEAIQIKKEGKKILLVGGAGTSYQEGKIDTSGEQKGGEILLQSRNRTVVGEGSRTIADAREEGGEGGEIKILSQGDTYVRGGLIEARGGTGGRGGFVEISAESDVNLGGAEIDTGAEGGEGGRFLLDPDTVTIDQDTYYHGGDADIWAEESITVKEGVTLSTRQIKGADTRENHMTKKSVGDSGSITMEAPKITLEKNATLLTFANNGYKSGKITLKAVDTKYPIGDIKVSHAKATINIEGAYLKGGDINIQAEAGAEMLFDDNSNPSDFKLDFLFDEPATPGALSIAKADATINIKSDSYIEGDNVTISSSAATNAKVHTLFTALSVAYGQTDPKAKIEVENGAQIISQGDLSLKASSYADATIKAWTANLGRSRRGSQVDFTLAYCSSDSEATVQVDSGAKLESGGDLKLDASLEKNLLVRAVGGAYEDGTVGVGVAISKSSSNVNALLDGDATAKGDVEVKADIDIEKNKTAAESSVGSNLVARQWIKGANKVLDSLQEYFTDKVPNTDPRSQGQKVALSAAFTYSEHEENAVARIGKGARVIADWNQPENGGDLSVEATIDYKGGATEGMQTSALAEIASHDPNNKDYAVAGAVDVTKFTNKAQAYIDDNAQVDAMGTLTVKSNVHIPYEITWYDIHGPEDILEKLNPNVGIQSGFFTTWAQSISEGEVVGVAGSFNYFSLDNTSEAYIGESALVNQDEAYQSDYQKVKVEALSDAETFNLSGVFGLKGGGVEGKTGIGGAYLQVDYTNNTTATIKQGAKVKAEALSLKADSGDNTILIAESGGAAGKYGVDCSFSLLNADVSTEAQIEGGAEVETRNGVVDENGDNVNLLIDAEETGRFFNISGGVMKGKNVGIGVSTSLTEVKRDTKALIGEADSTSKAKVTAGGDVKVKASNSGWVSTWALAGALSIGARNYDSEGDPAAEEGDNIPSEVGGGNLKSGFSIAGDAAYNHLSGTTEAAIISTDLTSAKGGVTLEAADDVLTSATTGTAALVIGSGGTSLGIAGSVSVNESALDIYAYMQDSTVTCPGDVSLTADSKDVLWAVSAGGAGAPAVSDSFTGALAGSVSYNNSSNSILAYLEGVDLSAGKISLSATEKPSGHDNRIIAKAGTLEVGGKLGVGAGVAINKTGDQVGSYIKNSRVEASKALSLSSEMGGDYHAAAASLAATSGKVALAGGVVINEISDEVYSGIESDDVASGNVTASGDVTLTSSYNTTIFGGGCAFDGSSLGSVGVGVVYNSSSTSVKSYIKNAEVDSKRGSVALKATYDGTVVGRSAGIGGSKTTNIAGSVVVNELANDTEAYISGSQVSAYNSLVVVAQGEEDIAVFDGIMGGSKVVSVGGTATVTTSENDTKAYIENSQVEAKGHGTYTVPKADGSGDTQEVRGVGVVATNSSSLDLETGDLEGAADVGVAAAASVNIFKDSSQAYILDSDVNTVEEGADSGQEVLVQAFNGVSTSVKAGGLACVGEAGFGATVDVTVLKNVSKAYVQRSQVNAKGDVKVASATKEQSKSVVVSGTFAGYASLAGSVGVLESYTDNEAYVSGSQVNAGGNLSVVASDEALFGVDSDGSGDGIIVGAASLGKAAGIGGSIAVNGIYNTTKAYITNSQTNSHGDTTVNATGKQRVKVFAATAALGKYVGAAGSVTVNTIAVDTQGYIEGSEVNQGALYGSDSGKVSVSAQNDSYIESTPGDVDAGIVGAGSSIDVSSVRNTVQAYLGDGVKASGGKGVEVKATGSEDVTSRVVALGGGAVSVQGSVSIVKVGSAISGDGKNAAKDAGDKIDESISGSKVEDMLGDTTIGNSAKEKADSETDNLSVAEEFDTDAQFQHVTEAYIGNGASIYSGGSVEVDATDTTGVSIFSGEGSLGVVGAGGSVGIGILKKHTYAWIGSSQIYGGGSSGNVEVTATSEVKDTKVKAYAGSVDGTVGLGAAVSYMDSENKVEAYVGDDASIYNTKEFRVEANMTSNIEAKSLNGSVGAIVAGGVYSRASEKGGAWASLGSNVNVGTSDGGTLGDKNVGDVNIKAVADSTMKSTLWVAEGGIGSGSYSEATTENSPTAKATISNNADFDLYGSMDVLAIAKGGSDSESWGLDLGGVSVGPSKAKAEWSPTVEASIGDDSEIKAAGDVSFRAYNNYDESGNELDNGVYVYSRSSNGDLVGYMGAYCETSGSPWVEAGLGSKVNVNTSGKLLIEAKSKNKVEMNVTGKIGGLATKGTTQGYNNWNDHVRAYAANAAEVYSAKGIELHSCSSDSIVLNDDGGEGGILSEGGAPAESYLTRDSLAEVGSAVLLSSPVNVTVFAEGLSAVNTNSSVKAGGGIDKNEAKAVSSITSTTKATVGDFSHIYGGAFDLKAKDLGSSAVASAYSETVAFGSESAAYTNADVTANTEASVGEWVHIHAPDGVSITAEQPMVMVTSLASSRIIGVAGILKAIAEGTLDATSKADVSVGTTIDTSKLYVSSLSTPSPLYFVVIADTTSDAIPFKRVQKEEKTYSRESSISFDLVSVNMLAGASPHLYVDANGNVTSSGDVDYEVLPDRVVVKDVKGPPGAEATFYVPEGTLSGHVDFVFDNAYSNVKIVNDSSKDLEIVDIDAEGQDIKPDVKITAADSSNFTKSVTEVDNNGQVEITNNGDSNVYLSGKILNPDGTVRIEAEEGDILSSSTDQFIESKYVYLKTPRGKIGTSDSFVNVRLYNDGSGTPKLNIKSNEDTFVKVTGILSGSGSLDMGVGAIVGGDYHLLIGQGLKESTDSSGNTTYTSVDSTCFLNYTVAAGDIYVSGPDSVTLNVNDEVTSGLANISFTIEPDGSVSSTYFNYVDHEDDTTVYLDDIHNGGGHIYLEAGNLTGYGLLQVLNGYTVAYIKNNCASKVFEVNDIILKEVEGSVVYNGRSLPLGSSYGSVSIRGYGNGWSFVDVTNNGHYPMVLNGDIYVDMGAVSLSSPKADIEQYHGSILVAPDGDDVTIETGGSFVQYSGTSIEANTNAQITTGGDLIINSLKVRKLGGEIDLNSGGKLFGVDASSLISASYLNLKAENGMGSYGDGNPLRVYAETLSVDNVRGDVFIRDIRPYGTNLYSAKNAGGKFSLTTDGPLFISSRGVEAEGDVGFLVLNGDLHISGPVTSRSGFVGITTNGTLYQEASILAYKDVNLECGELDMDGDLVVTESQEGNIDISVGGDAYLTRLITGTEEGRRIYIAAEGAILNAGNPGELVTHDLILDAWNGIGYSNGLYIPLNTRVSRLDVTNRVSGEVFLNNTGDLVLQDLTWDGFSAVNYKGGFFISTTGTMTVKSPVRAYREGVILKAQDSFVQEASGDILGNTDIQVSASNGTIVMEDGAETRSETGSITYYAQGDVTVGRLVTGKNSGERVRVTSGTGKIIDGGDSGGPDIVTHDLIISAAKGIGYRGGRYQALEVEVDRMDAANSVMGPIMVDNQGDLTLVDLNYDGLAVSNKGGNINIEATGNVDVLNAVEGSGEIFLEAGGSLSQGVQGDITAVGDLEVKALSGSITMADGAVSESQEGSIYYTAQGDVTIGRLITGVYEGREVDVVSAEGAIVDGGDTGGADVVTEDLKLSAAKGIGFGNALDTQVGYLDAVNSGTGSIEIENTGSLVLMDLNHDGFSLLNEGGDIEVWARQGDLDAWNQVESYQRNVGLYADNDVILESAVSGGEGANIVIYADANDDGTGSITQVSGRLGDLRVGDQHLVLKAAEGIEVPCTYVSSLNAYNSTSGDIHVVNRGGDLKIEDRLLGTGWGVENLGGNVRLENERSIIFTGESKGVFSIGDVHLLAGMAIEEMGDTTAVEGKSLVMEAEEGIGVYRSLLTRVETLEAHNNREGDIRVLNEGALLLQDIDPDLGEAGVAVSNAGGGVYISAASPLTVASRVEAEGDIELWAMETGDLGDDLTLGADVESYQGDITLLAGDDVVQERNTLVEAREGEVKVVAGYQDEDRHGAIIQERRSTILAKGEVELRAKRDVKLAKVISKRAGIKIKSEKGSILDNNGDKTNLYARADSYLWAKKIIGRYDDPLDVKIKGGDLYVYAGGKLKEVSVDINGVVKPSNRLKVYYGVPPGLVIFNGRIIDWGRLAEEYMSAISLSNYMELRELERYRILLDLEELLKEEAVPWEVRGMDFSENQ